MAGAREASSQARWSLGLSGQGRRGTQRGVVQSAVLEALGLLLTPLDLSGSCSQHGLCVLGFMNHPLALSSVHIQVIYGQVGGVGGKTGWTR